MLQYEIAPPHLSLPIGSVRIIVHTTGQLPKFNLYSADGGTLPYLLVNVLSVLRAVVSINLDLLHFLLDV